MSNKFIAVIISSLALINSLLILYNFYIKKEDI